MISVLRTSRAARVLVVSNLFAVLGDTVLILVLAIWVKELTGSSGEAGGVFAALGLPALLSLLGGRAVDGLTPRSALITANAISVLALCPLYLVSGPGQVWIIYAATCVYGGGTFLYQAARASAAARAVPPEGRPALVSVLRSTRQVMTVIAPSAGAFVFTELGHGVVVGIAILALVASSIISLRLHLAYTESGPQHESYKGILAGIGHVWRSAVLRQLTGAMMIYLTVAGFFQVGVIQVLGDLHEPVGLLGPVATVQGLGSVTGAALAPYLCTRLSEARLVAAGLAVEASGAVILAAVSIQTVFAGAFLIGLGLPLLLVGSDTALMNKTPMPLQGRTSLAVEVITSLPLTASFASASLIINVIGSRALMLVMAVVTAISVPMAFTSDSAGGGAA